MPFLKLISRNFHCIEQQFDDISINFSILEHLKQREVKDEEVENLENRFSWLITVQIKCCKDEVKLGLPFTVWKFKNFSATKILRENVKNYTVLAHYF